MGEQCFLHLSDIHFGQEKGSEVVYHKDVKDQLILYVAELAKERRKTGRPPFAGVLVTGDIAYAGKEAEYTEASKWLKQLTDAIDCDQTDVQVVPGNHDIDRALISTSARYLLDKISAEGEPSLDVCLENEMDREVLYQRFTAYRPFAYSYGCPLSLDGGGAGEKPFELGNGRTLRFLGLNSALLCKAKDKPGELLLGARQHVIAPQDGVVHAVLSHHPLHWFSDEVHAKTYLRNRTSVLLSGHEHSPRCELEEVDGEPRFLWIAAGALVPPYGHAGYNYVFNILEFRLSDDGSGVDVTVDPHCWDGKRVRFDQDHDRFKGPAASKTFHLRCPNFDVGEPAKAAKLTGLSSLPIHQGLCATRAAWSSLGRQAILLTAVRAASYHRGSGSYAIFPMTLLASLRVP